MSQGVILVGKCGGLHESLLMPSLLVHGYLGIYEDFDLGALFLPTSPFYFCENWVA